ncbi:MAG: type II glyceraldehyde-3-phosphate dehydrogenase [Desulfurococcaceae archaeon]
MIRVGVVGYGTIGKRVADAVARQDDMVLVGVFKTRPNYEAYAASARGYRLFVPPDREKEFVERGLKVSGHLEDLVEGADVIVDASPGGVGAKNREIYERHGRRAIFQGGEKASVAEVSFNALANYGEAVGKRYVRVVSCNTTALVRLIWSLSQVGDIASVRATIIRRGSDPKEIERGPINGLVLDPPAVPSHHAVDVKTILRDLDIVTVAVAAPTTLMHVHSVLVRFKGAVTRDAVVEALSRTPRIVLVSSKRGEIRSTSEVVEYSRDLGRARYDIHENVVWEDTIYVGEGGRELMLMQGVHQEAIVIPENVDAIRASTGIERDPFKSIEKTDRSLGVVRGRWL